MKSNIYTLIIGLIFTSSIFAASNNDENYVIRWKERNGEIIYETVCSNYKKGSIIYRNCRAGAQQYFREKCHNSDDKRNKFCTAESNYNPL